MKYEMQPVETNGQEKDETADLLTSQEEGQKSQKSRSVGRPTLLDDGRVAALTSALEVGMTIKEAAHTAGVSVSTLKNWRKEYPDLDEVINRAIAQARLTAFKTLHKASADGDVQAAKALLDRTDPDRIEQRALTIQRQRQQILHAESEENRRAETHTVELLNLRHRIALVRAQFRLDFRAKFCQIGNTARNAKFYGPDNSRAQEADRIADDVFCEILGEIFYFEKGRYGVDARSHLRGTIEVALNKHLTVEQFPSQERTALIVAARKVALAAAEGVQSMLCYGMPPRSMVDELEADKEKQQAIEEAKAAEEIQGMVELEEKIKELQKITCNDL